MIKIYNWPTVHFGSPNSIPVVGDWNGDGRDTPGVVLPSSIELQLIDNLSEFPVSVVSVKLPAGVNWVSANWFGGTMDTLAVIDKDDNWIFLPGNRACYPSNPFFRIEIDSQSGIPLAGNWGR